MSSRLWLGLGVAGLLAAAPALAQQASPRFTADDFTRILKTETAQAQQAGAPSFTADQLAAILTPGQKLRTRSLVAGEGVEPGAPGSGVVPDLKITFGSNSADLTPEARATLSELGKALQRDELRSLSFEISGHTDAKGSDRYNEQLSRKRAASVVSFLQRDFGIEPDRLRAVGYGERKLADPNDPDNWVNRRVEIRTMTSN